MTDLKNERMGRQAPEAPEAFKAFKASKVRVQRSKYSQCRHPHGCCPLHVVHNQYNMGSTKRPLPKTGTTWVYSQCRHPGGCRPFHVVDLVVAEMHNARGPPVRGCESGLEDLGGRLLMLHFA